MSTRALSRFLQVSSHPDENPKVLDMHRVGTECSERFWNVRPGHDSTLFDQFSWPSTRHKTRRKFYSPECSHGTIVRLRRATKAHVTHRRSGVRRYFQAEMRQWLYEVLGSTCFLCVVPATWSKPYGKRGPPTRIATRSIWDDVEVPYNT